jgi:hypothetical protein
MIGRQFGGVPNMPGGHFGGNAGRQVGGTPI